jgi:hypothetical protein
MKYLKGIYKNLFIEKSVAFIPQLFPFISYFLPKFMYLIAEKVSYCRKVPNCGIATPFIGV